jgi:hypothetical protein
VLTCADIALVGQRDQAAGGQLADDAQIAMGVPPAMDLGRSGPLRRGFDHVLAVIQHQQQLPPGQRARQRPGRLHRGQVTDP